MDTTVAGLNKVRCRAASSADAGKTVTITDGTLTWEKTLSSSSPYDCVFLIPSMPAPAKNSYTITLHNGDASAAAKYARTIELGFGDSVEIGLHSNFEPVDKKYVYDNRYILPKAAQDTLGGVKKGNGIRIYSDGSINVETRNSYVAISFTSLQLSAFTMGRQTIQITDTSTREKIDRGEVFSASSNVDGILCNVVPTVTAYQYSVRFFNLTNSTKTVDSVILYYFYLY